MTPGQLKNRERVESLIGVAAPVLDFILLIGDRISRVVEPEDHEYYPARPLAEPAVAAPSRQLDSDTGQ
jgi:hypothetical protein